MAKEKGLKNLAFLSLTIIVLFGPYTEFTLAKTELAVSQTTIYDQNIFRNYMELPDWVNQSMIRLDRQFDFRAAHFRASYSGDVSFFQTYHDRRFHTHKANIESFFPLSDNYLLNTGSEFKIRLNKTEYDYFDSNQWLIYSQLRIQHWQTNPIQFEFQVRSKDFKNLDEFSHRESLGSIRVKHFFPTKTTIIGQLAYSSKNYLNDQTIEEFVIIKKDTIIQRGNGRGRGPLIPKTLVDSSVIAHNMSIPETRQWVMSLKFAQSIFPKTGISLQYARRFNPTQNTRYLQGQEYSYTKDDELYDDPYSYGSHELQFVLTQILPWKSQLKMFAEFYDKNYTYALDLLTNKDQTETSPNRSDQQSIFGLYMSKKIGMSRFTQNIECYLSTYYLLNQSNDPYFDFDSYSMSGGIEITF